MPGVATGSAGNGGGARRSDSSRRPCGCLGACCRWRPSDEQRSPTGRLCCGAGLRCRSTCPRPGYRPQQRLVLVGNQITVFGVAQDVVTGEFAIRDDGSAGRPDQGENPVDHRRGDATFTPGWVNLGVRQHDVGLIAAVRLPADYLTVHTGFEFVVVGVIGDGGLQSCMCWTFDAAHGRRATHRPAPARVRSPFVVDGAESLSWSSGWAANCRK
jgi:hypothetical protein